jgi:hypothetical protein
VYGLPNECLGDRSRAEQDNSDNRDERGIMVPRQPTAVGYLHADIVTAGGVA